MCEGVHWRVWGMKHTCREKCSIHFIGSTVKYTDHCCTRQSSLNSFGIYFMKWWVVIVVVVVVVLILVEITVAASHIRYGGVLGVLRRRRHKCRRRLIIRRRRRRWLQS